MSELILPAGVVHSEPMSSHPPLIPNSGRFFSPIEDKPCLIEINKAFTPHWKENFDADEYHSIRTAVNSSSLKAVRHSEFEFKRMFIDGLVKEPTRSMKFGTHAHMAILEGAKFRERYAIMPEFTGFTKDGRESKLSADAKAKKASWIEEQTAANRIIISQEEFDKLMFMIDSFMSNSDAVRLLTSGITEISGFYADPETGIVCRIRPDFLSFSLSAMVDVKTVSKVSVDWFRKNRVESDEFMYYFQMSMYDVGTSIISGKPVDFPTWILIGSEPPYECIVIPMEQAYREIGVLHYHDALKKLRKCIDENCWNRQPTIQTMHPSFWFMEKQEIA